MDFGMLEPLCDARQVNLDYDRLVESSRREFYIEVEVEFVYLAEPPGATSDCQDDRLMPEVSHEERYGFWIAANELLQDADGERNVRFMLTEAGVMYTRHHEFMVQTVLSEAASVASDEHNRDAEVLPMRVSISCADPCIHPELTVSEEEALEVTYDEAEDMDTSEDNEEEITMLIGLPRLEGLTEVEVKERGIDCVICCEAILAGSTGSSMPCCHVYHRGCIAKWLKNSRTCPLCRFELPPTY